MIKTIWRSYLVHNKYFLKVLSFLNNLFRNKLRLVIILWPPVNNFFKPIEEEISNQFKILYEEEFQISRENIKNFIFEIYKLDFADPRKIVNKHESIYIDDNKFKFFIVEINNPEFYVKDLLNRYGSKKISEFKKKIRLRYKNKIKNYVYDIIIHSTEMRSQEEKFFEILDKYKIKNET